MNKLDQLEERIVFWDQKHKIVCQGSTPVGENILRKYCRKNNILEIGPGEGRQFCIANPISGTYSIADISSIVLENSIYACCKDRFLITNYDAVLGKFDVV